MARRTKRPPVTRDFGVTTIGDGLFTTEAFLAANPTTTQAFIDATLKGWEYAVAHAEETVTILADYNPELTVDQLTFEAQETIKLLRYGAGATCLGWNDRAAWEAEHTLLVDLKILKAPVNLDVAMNDTFVANAYHQRGIRRVVPNTSDPNLVPARRTRMEGGVRYERR